MESLVGYGSDDDYDEVSQSKKQAQTSSQADVNYEEVQMDLSEDSNDSTKFDSRHQSRDYHPKYKNEHRSSKESDYRDKDRFKRSSEDKYKYEHSRSSPKSQESRKDDKYKDRSRNNDRRSREQDDRSRERDDKSREHRKDKNRDDKSTFRDDRGRESRRNRDDQDRYKDAKDDRRSYRASSRERHRSRSPKRSDYRSSSRERNRNNYTKRYDRTSNKMDRLEKLGIELNTGPESASTSSQMYSNERDSERDRFFMPGITGRFTEQIQRRKMLWQKKEPVSAVPETIVSPPQTQKVWQNTTFAQDTDGKVANKFKRLMGIRGNQSEVARPVNDNLRKQEEMFTSMEAQYEVARTATHTMRGVGLGFGSFQR